jgi:ribosomal protein S18 acetylase RimI-like enzyme
MEWRTLETTPLAVIHAAFIEAFSDSIVPFDLPFEQLDELLTRRGFVPQLSLGGFESGRLVCFTLNAMGSWNGLPTAYDTGTGVLPTHRRRGLAAEMMRSSEDLLRAAGAVQYLLEVIEANIGAVQLYERAGFETTRELQCWTLATAPEVRESSRSTIRFASDLPGDCGDWMDVQPSWQNTFESLARTQQPREVAIAETGSRQVGFAIAFPMTGDLPLLAVDPVFRRRGVGRALLCAVAARTSGLQIVNIDAASEPVHRFLEASGATSTIRQFEMLRPLG